MNIQAVYAAVSPYFRRRRMRRFLREMQPGPETTILDVGGSKSTWEYTEGLTGRITILNLLPPSDAERADKRYDFVVGDATALPYPDKSFDVVFSNSVIEHVGDFDKQTAFACEAVRVGRAIWVQTPAKEFFVEPHLIAPFFHWLPTRWQHDIAPRFTLWGLMTKPTAKQVAAFLATIRLLSAREFRALFPGATIVVERLLGMPKSYIAVCSSTAAE
jgi:hypothetical protein